jgi:hypothetical protein
MDEILVEGFYDDVVPLGDADRRQIAEVPFDEEEYKRAVLCPIRTQHALSI